MDAPRAPKSGTASALSEMLFQKSVPLEQVPRARWAAPVIVNWSRSKDIESARLKEKELERKRGSCGMSIGPLVPRECYGFCGTTVLLIPQFCPHPPRLGLLCKTGQPSV